MTDNPTLTWLQTAAYQRERDGLRRQLKPRTTDGRQLLDLASNDYLGLARDPRVVAGAILAAKEWGAGSTGSRLVTGSTQLHAALEHALAAHVQTQSALVFSSGYLANIGILTALGGADCLIVSDELNHASLIDACRLSRSPITITKHRDVAAVERALRNRVETRALVVTDAVFSVDGDIAPLTELHRLARQYGSMLIVDEAHSLGVIGEGGVGACAAAGVADQPDVVQTLTLSKSLGSQGGAIAGTREVVEHILNAARSFIFDTGLAPSSAGAAFAALSILSEQPQLAKSVRSNAEALSALASQIGWNVTTPVGAVTSVLVGDPTAAVDAAAVCADSGVRVGCFRPPSVPDGVSRLRITARADLSEADLELATRGLQQAHDSMATR